MFRRCLCFLLAAAVALTLCGCSVKFSRGTVEEIKKQLKNLKAYQCDVKVSVTNNKSTLDYTMKHFYKRPDKYRIEIETPGELKGQAIIYSGGKACIFHPGIKQYLVTENFTGSMEYDVFAGSFLERLQNDTDALYMREKVGDKQYFTMEFDIKDGNIYIQKGKIWFDIQTAIPCKSELYDRDGKTTVQICYENFDVNPALDDKIFEIPEAAEGKN